MFNGIELFVTERIPPVRRLANEPCCHKGSTRRAQDTARVCAECVVYVIDTTL